MNSRILTVIVAATLLGALALVVTRDTPVTGQAKTVRLMELGVQIDVPASISDLTYEPRTSRERGAVLRMMISESCELGAIFSVAKKPDALKAAGYTSETIAAATQYTGDTPPRAKEFTDFYIVFEPSQSTCTSDAQENEAEAKKRSDLQNALTTAQFIRF